MSPPALLDKPELQYENLCSLFFKRAQQNGDIAFLWERRQRGWHSHSWQEISAQVLLCAAALRQRGVSQGMRVAIVSENRKEWVISDLAIMLIGAISVPLFTNQTSTDYGYLLRQSGARAVICSTSSIAHQVEPAAQAANGCLFMVVMSPGKIFSSFASLAVLSWADLLDEGRSAKPLTAQDADKIKQQDIACIIYNSGASEAPKGAMLTHKSIIANMIGIDDIFKSLHLDDERILSFLPLSHAYEHTVGLYYPIHIHSQIYFLPRPELLTTAMLEVKPTLMTAVPRLYDLLKERLEVVFRQRGPLASFLFTRAVRHKKTVPPWHYSAIFDKIEALILDIMICNPVNQRLGGHLKAFISGGAALKPDVAHFFTSLNVKLLQGYGLTEASPVVSVNPPEKVKLRTVGRALKGAEVKISSQGELCVRGDMVMAGYWDDPAATRQTIKKGWLHTGDLAEIDDDGYITILGVKRDMIVNSGGENISPLRVELILTSVPEIAQAVIVGDSRPFITAILTPSETLQTLSQDKDNPDEWIERKLKDAVQTANANLSPVERIRYFTVTDEAFSTSNGCLTATGDLRRKVILETYQKRIEALYHRRKR